MKAAKALRALGVAGALALFAASEARAMTLETVVLGRIDSSVHAVAGALVEEVLDRLGHPVEVVEGLPGEVFPLLDEGEIDLLAAAWLPRADAGYWTRYGGRAVELATLYEGVRLSWAVPAYVPEDWVASIADLAKWEVLARMDRDIRGLGPDSGVMRASAKAIEAYGLADLYRLVPEDSADWVERIRRATRDGRWFVLPLWRPQWLNQAYELRPLGDPQRVFGQEDRAVLVAHEVFARRAPPRTLAVLRKLRLSVEAVTEMDHMVNVDGLAPRTAARRWMAQNQGLVDGWF